MTWILAWLAFAQADPLPEDTVMVIVAARNLQAGIQIKETDLYAVEIPPRFVPEGVFLSPDHVVGRFPRERVLANEYIRSERLANNGGDALADKVPQGRRAASIAISTPVATALKSGGTVDLYVREVDNSCALAVAASVLRVEIADDAAWLIVALTPEQLLVAASKPVTVAIRNETDTQSVSPVSACKLQETAEN